MKRLSQNYIYKHRAFTLVELIVVMVLLGILLAITVPNFRGFTDTRQLVDSVKTVESELKKAFSMARSEGKFVDITIDGTSSETTQLLRCERDNKEEECASLQEPVLINDIVFGDAFRVQSDIDAVFSFSPPHGDILIEGDPDIIEIVFTHQKSEDSRTLRVHELSGLVEIIH